MNQTQSIFDEYLNRKLVMVTGKGGVGKSFLSLMLALRASKLGKKVLLIELTSQSQHQVPLGLENKKHYIQKHSDTLDHINIVYEYNFRDYVIKYLGMEKVFQQVFNRDIVKSFLRMVPGLNEITFLGRLFYECTIKKSNSYDLLIFDAFSSGHFYKLMTTPDGILHSGLVGPVLQESQNIKNFLARNEDIATIYTCIPERLVVNEVGDFVHKINDNSPVNVDAIVLNRCIRSQEKQWSEQDDLSSYFRELAQLKEESIASLMNLELPNTVIATLNNIGPVDPVTLPLKFTDYWHEAHLESL